MYDVAIIDSGVDCSHSFFQQFPNVHIEGVCIQYNEGNPTFSNSISDNIGHGTAVASIFCSHGAQSIYVIKLFDKETEIDEDLLCLALKWINEHLSTKIIHISAGVTQCSKHRELFSICSDITNNNKIIVAAFDNMGSLSYPAAFPNVIGVDCSLMCTSSTDYIYVENSPINIRATGTSQRLPWLNNTYKTVAGTSFSAPHISALIMTWMKNGLTKADEIKEELKVRSKKILPSIPTAPVNTLPTFSKAIILPFNKEIHPILENSTNLPFEIVGFFDHPYLYRANLKSFMSICKRANCRFSLSPWNQIDWSSDFDTVIVGHIKHLGLLANQDFLASFISLCSRYKKNIISFDSLEPYSAETSAMNNHGLFAYYPHATGEYCSSNWFGKMPELVHPVLGVFGTGKRQGKFSLQLALKKEFINRDFTVGHLGTEPTAELFGADYCYPTGYFGEISKDAQKAVENIRYLLHLIDLKDPDLIITGGQSQTLSPTSGNSYTNPYQNYYLLVGANPDAIILVVNIDDDYEYIYRTIQYCEGLSGGKVLCLVISPIVNTNRWSTLGGTFLTITNDEYQIARTSLNNSFSIPVFSFTQIQEITHTIIQYFSPSER